VSQFFIVMLNVIMLNVVTRYAECHGTVNIVFQYQDTLINFLTPPQSGKCQNDKGQKVKGPGPNLKKFLLP
jgi:hypothetical protein